MIKDSGKRLFDIVIVWKLDRFARNRYDSARYKATLKKNGVKVVSATRLFQRARRASFSNPSSRAMRNTTPPTFRKRSFAA